MRSFFIKPGIPAFALVPGILMILAFAGPARATTAVLLSDEQLITTSRVILLGEVRSVSTQMDYEKQSIYSYVRVAVTEVIKGDLRGEMVVIKQLGGTFNNQTSVVFGAPDYAVGQRLLLFLNTAKDGTLRIAHLFQGKYDVTNDPATGKVRVRRDLSGKALQLLGQQDGAGFTNSAALGKFLNRVRDTLATHREVVTANDSRHLDTPIIEVPPDYLAVPDGTGQALEVTPHYVLFSARWRQPDSAQPVVFRLNSNNAPVAGGGVNEINQGLAAWTNVTTTALVLQNGGSTTAGGFRNQDGVTAIAFNDPLGEIQDPVGCSGTLAIGGYSSAGSPIHTVGGQSFYSIIEADVVFNNNFTCFLGNSLNLAEVACHEIGHAIGFNHSGDPNAIMAPSARGGRGAVLGADDIAAVSFLYPGSKSTPPPPIVPAAPSNLSATAASTGSINLAWNDASNNESGFRIERKTGATGAYGEIATVPAGQASYTNTDLSAATIYFYRVRAYNTAGPSAYSNEASATTSSSLPPAGDNDNDGIPNVVEIVEGRNPLVKDNDIFTLARLFVMQQYRDFLGREGDAAGITHWTSQLNSGAQSRVQMVDSFFTSAEFSAVNPVARLYFAYFLRIPDYDGLTYWVNQYRAGMSLNLISQAFASSPEFQNTYGSLTNSQFVALVYQNMLGRPADAEGLAYWTGHLNSGTLTRGQVMLNFSESAENLTVSFTKVFVVQIYIGMLRRSPDQGGFDFWIGQLNSGRSRLDLISSFLASSEYRQRFLP